MVNVKIYVEGGDNLDGACRKAFSELLKNAGFKGKMPRIVASGSRKDAYDAFCNAINNPNGYQHIFLLVDSEAPVDNKYQQGDDSAEWQPWGHLKQRVGDNWDKPENTTDTQCHLMVQFMESWLLADADNLKRYYGNIKINALPDISAGVEVISKKDVIDGLKKATKECNKKFRKGVQSYEILEGVDSAGLEIASPWFKRLIAELGKVFL